MQDGHRGSTRPSPRAEAGRFVGYGMSWLATMLLFGWGGLELDRRIGTTPLLLILGILLGFAAGLCTLYTRAVAEPANNRPGKGKALRRPREES